MVLNVASIDFQWWQKIHKKTEGGNSKSDRKKSKGPMQWDKKIQQMFSQKIILVIGLGLGIIIGKVKRVNFEPKIGHL